MSGPIPSPSSNYHSPFMYPTRPEQYPAVPPPPPYPPYGSRGDASSRRYPPRGSETTVASYPIPPYPGYTYPTQPMSHPPQIPHPSRHEMASKWNNEFSKRLEHWQMTRPKMCGVCLDDKLYQSSNGWASCSNPACDVIVHRSCNGFPWPPTIEEGVPWTCERCSWGLSVLDAQCAVCSLPGGVLRRLAPPHDGWAHIICCIWTPEMSALRDPAGQSHIVITSEIQQRCGRECLICERDWRVNEGQSITLECTTQDCSARMHPSCAHAFGLLSETVRSGDKASPEADPYVFFCPTHSSHIRRPPLQFVQWFSWAASNPLWQGQPNGLSAWADMAHAKIQKYRPLPAPNYPSEIPRDVRINEEGAHVMRPSQPANTHQSSLAVSSQRSKYLPSPSKDNHRPQEREKGNDTDESLELLVQAANLLDEVEREDEQAQGDEDSGKLLPPSPPSPLRLTDQQEDKMIVKCSQLLENDPTLTSISKEYFDILYQREKLDRSLRSLETRMETILDASPVPLRDQASLDTDPGGYLTVPDLLEYLSRLPSSSREDLGTSQPRYWAKLCWECERGFTPEQASRALFCSGCGGGRVHRRCIEDVDLVSSLLGDWSCRRCQAKEGLSEGQSNPTPFPPSHFTEGAEKWRMGGRRVPRALNLYPPPLFEEMEEVEDKGSATQKGSEGGVNSRENASRPEELENEKGSRGRRKRKDRDLEDNYPPAFKLPSESGPLVQEHSTRTTVDPNPSIHPPQPNPHPSETTTTAIKRMMMDASGMGMGPPPPPPPPLNHHHAKGEGESSTDASPMRKKSKFEGKPPHSPADDSNQLVDGYDMLPESAIEPYLRERHIYPHSAIEWPVGLSDERPQPPQPDAILQTPKTRSDMYTPRWLLGQGSFKSGLCPLCPTLRWFRMKFSAYWYHMNFHHGISSHTFLPFPAPSAMRFNRYRGVKEALCPRCHQWVVASSSKNVAVKVQEIYWWKHAQKCFGKGDRAISN